MSIDESLRYIMKNKKGKKKNCSLYKSETNIYKHVMFGMNAV